MSGCDSIDAEGKVSRVGKTSIKHALNWLHENLVLVLIANIEGHDSCYMGMQWSFDWAEVFVVP